MPGHPWDAATLDALTAKLTRRFGPSAAAWVAAVPDRAADLATRWRLGLGAPFVGGASSVALRCTLADGSHAVLKLSPDRRFLAEQVAVLRLFAAGGRVPAVLAAEDGAMLLEAVEPGTPVESMAGAPTPAEYAALLTGLHRAASPRPGLLPRDLWVWTDEFLHNAAARLTEPEVAAALREGDLRVALVQRDALLDPPPPDPVLLHGDLHLGNVLDGGDRGLVAIDPKACAGEPCFDAVDYVLAGAGRAGADGIAGRRDALAAEAGLDADRLHAWCRVAAPVTAIPLLRAGGRDEAVAELLDLVR